MIKSLFLAAFVVALFSSAPCRASGIKVQVFNDGEATQSMSFPDGQVKASAKSVEFDATTNSWNLAKDCAITIERLWKSPMRLEGDKASIKVDQIEWQIFAIHYDVSQDLSEFLKSHPETSLVRVTWGWSMGGYGSSSTALYDRKRKLIKEYDVSGDTHMGGTWRESYLLTGVTDAMLDKATKEHNPQDEGQFSFKTLTDYGAVHKERH